MVLRKVYGGTPVGNESRCDTCVNARIIQGYAESERIVICIGPFDQIRVPFKVMQCSMYEDRRLPDYETLKDIAWDVRARQNGPRAGFVMASDLNRNDSATEEPEPQIASAGVTQEK
jgi:hypothetical protein